MKEDNMKQGWEIKKLGEVCKITMGQSPSSNTYNDSEGLPFYQGNADFGKVNPIARVYCNAPIRIAENNDILISVRAPIGAINIANCKCCIGRGLASIRSTKTLSNEFVYHALIANKEKLIAQGTGSTFKSIGRNTLEELPIPVPPLPVQEQIVSELDLLSGIIEKKREQLKELDALAQSIFYDMFGDPITNEKGWEVKKLGDISQIASGGTPSRKITEYFTGDINWYSAGELNSMFLTDSIEKISQNALDETSAKLFPKGSLLVGMYDTAAFKLGILEKASSSNQACANIALYEDNIIWLYYVLLLMKDEALKHRHGARQKNLNVGFIKDFTIPIAPIDLQRQFATKIEAIEKKKELIKQSINETETLFNERMQHYFN